MHTKTMEGLVGARTNMDLLNTPMRIYREARRKGDTGTMERAMGYANEFADKAEEYRAEADEGMKEDAKEAREKEKLEQEEALQKRRAEREKLKESMGENKGEDTIEVSEEGKLLLKEDTDLKHDNISEVNADVVKEPVIYTKTGEPVQTDQLTTLSVSV